MIARRYWDSAVFLGWFKNEPDKWSKCKGVIKKAEDGEIIMVTSALTLTEVIKLKNHAPLPEKDETLIRRFFEQDFIAVRVVDRIIAEEARRLVWRCGVQPKDAIHLATALKLKMNIFDSFDGELIKLSGKFGDPLLRICEPDISYQEEIFEKMKQSNKEET